MKTQEADRHMLERYRQVCECHPDTVLVPAFDGNMMPGLAIEMFAENKATHVAVQRGSCIFVIWAPSERLKWLFDAFAEQ